MKKIILFLLFLFLFNCDKDNGDSSAPISQLPPATQTGERTFGCLVDGKVFVHNEGIINCFYQLVDGEYYFAIGGDDDGIDPQSLYIQSQKRQIEEGQTYSLLSYGEGNVYGGAGFHNDGEAAFTDTQFTGELTITKFDFDSNIVSGTFWFDVQHPVTGEVVHITEGRFDTYFTQ